MVVSFVESSKLAEYQERHRWLFPVLADPERQAYQSFAWPKSLWQVFSPPTLKLYWRLIRQGISKSVTVAPIFFNPGRSSYRQLARDNNSFSPTAATDSYEVARPVA